MERFSYILSVALVLCFAVLLYKYQNCKHAIYIEKEKTKELLALIEKSKESLEKIKVDYAKSLKEFEGKKIEVIKVDKKSDDCKDTNDLLNAVRGIKF